MRGSVRALLAGIVDYAGLFPPAGLDMAAAVANYARYRGGPDGWLLGRFVCPVARLDEMFGLAGRPDETWRVSGIVGRDAAADLRAIDAFNRTNSGFVVDSAEVRSGAAPVADIAAAAPAKLRVFVEIPIDEDPAPLVKRIAASRLRAKVRTGGLTPDAFPAAGDLARFIRRCYADNTAFKATAGLHHPVRSTHALTYEPDAPRGEMFGFLNVFLAAAFCYNGLNAADAPRVLEEHDATRFQFDDDGVCWEDYRVSTAELETVRRRLATSFGSCSFEEPVDDLKQLKLI